MKNIFIILLLTATLHGFSQEKVVFLSSGPKLVNTLPFYKENSPLSYNITEKQLKTEISNGETLLYFDKSNKKTTPDKAFFYRKIKFNQNGLPIGLVEDFYSKSNTVKFSGNYLLYKNDNEKENNLYQGECFFYSEIGEKTIAKFVDGQKMEEKVLTIAGKIIKEQVFNPNRTRKYFKEILFDKDGKEIGNRQGRYNPTTKKEEYRTLITDSEGNYQSITEYEDGCPKLKVMKYREGGISYPVFIQDFTCSPNPKEWTLQANSQGYTVSHNETEKYYEINSTKDITGFLFTPIISDFGNKNFEINTDFEKVTQENIKEIGMVWQYQNENNYCYFTINLEKKTFEISSKVNGAISTRYMTGLKSQINITDTQKLINLRLLADPTNSKFRYFINNQEIQALNKFPYIAALGTKNWNIGIIFKATKANETINLKKIEIKLP